MRLNIQEQKSPYSDRLPPGGKKWILTVQDDGYGIPPEEQKFIFQEYKRGQRYKGDKQRKGFGLGLCYVAAVVKAHHGHIQVGTVTESREQNLSSKYRREKRKGERLEAKG